MNADVIISICAPTRACYVAAEVAIRTCAAYTDANIVVAANNMPVPEFKNNLLATAQALGVKWHWHESSPFNIAQCFNESFRTTSGKYYCNSGQDSVFYDNWLDNLIAAWEAEPDYFCLSPYSYNVWRKDFTRELPKNPRSGIQEVWPHCGSVMAFRRDKPWYYDENIPTECDSDLYQYIKRNRLKSGIVLNSRVDHLGQIVLSELGGWAAVTNNESQEDAKRLKEKWNL